jgi:hypothetical protein
MVGHIIIGGPAGTGSRSFDDFKSDSAIADWASVPPAARRTSLSLEEVMQKRFVS